MKQKKIVQSVCLVTFENSEMRIIADSTLCCLRRGRPSSIRITATEALSCRKDDMRHQRVFVVLHTALQSGLQDVQALLGLYNWHLKQNGKNPQASDQPPCTRIRPQSRRCIQVDLQRNLGQRYAALLQNQDDKLLKQNYGSKYLIRRFLEGIFQLIRPN
uniref:Uncharacterized protein n=1 Tax=Ditylenchus dipsaci TaxID=166011 RepID=A0A915DLR5_9BILA